MAWYNTGTVAIAATKVTGTGTNFLDSKFGIGAGQAFLIPGSGTVKMYEIASVEDATHLTLKTTAGTVAAGAAYAVMSFYTDSVPDFAKRLAAQLSYYQSQMDGWQQIMTGSGTIAMTAPDGTVVNISSFAKLTADIGSALQTMSGFFTGDLNTITIAGIYSPTSAALNTPIAISATMEHYVRNGGAAYTQIYHCNGSSSASINRHFIRTAVMSSGVATWSSWVSLTTAPMELGGVNTDLNTLFTSGNYYGNWANQPASMGNAYGIVEVTASGSASASSGIILQRLWATTANLLYTRTWNGSVWTAWAQVFMSNGTVPLANGGTGATTAAAAATALGVGAANTVTHAGIELIATTPYIDFHYGSSTADYTARMIMNDSLALTVTGTQLDAANSFRCRRGIGGAVLNSNPFNFYWNNTNLEAWIQTTQVGNVTLAAVSDKELKTGIVYSDEDPEKAGAALAEVLQWRTASFKYKARGVLEESDEQLGFIANDLVLISSECVKGEGLKEGWDENNPENAYYLDEIALIAKLTDALQTQQKQIEALQRTVTALTGPQEQTS